MRSALLLSLLACMTFAPHASANHLIHDRSSDLAGDAQGSPSSTVAYDALAGSFLVTVWEQQSGTQREFNVGVAALPLGSGAIADRGAPPAPAGYLWFGDPIVRAPRPEVSADGSFYLFGQIRSVGASPFTFGLGFLRGEAGAGATVAWDTPQVIETFGTHTVNQRYVNALSMDVDPASQVVHLAYFNTKPDFGGPPKSLWHRSSPDGGINWGAPALLGSDSTVLTGAAHVLCGPGGGEVTFLWRQIAGPVRTLRCRRSTDHGSTLGSIETVRSFAAGNQGAPHGVTGMPSAFATAVDRTGVAGAPTVYYLGPEEMAHASVSYPDPTVSASRSEVEPNGNAATATLVAAAGAVLRGGGAPADTDFFAFDLTATMPVMILSDSMATSLSFVSYAWLGPDGKSTLTGGTFLATSEGRVGFAAPIAGRFYLRLARSSAAGTGGYRIRTTSVVPPAGGARDQRDVFLSSTQPSQPWSTPVNASLTTGGIGFEESGVSLASNLDGYLYAGWFDWEAQPGQEVARRVMSRSPDGGQTWEPTQVLPVTPSDWLAALGTATATVSAGPWCATVTDGFDIHDVWVDVRNGDPDLYGLTIRRALEVTGVAPPAPSVQPGEVVTVDVTTRNLDDLFGWGVRLTADTPRGWALPAASASLAGGETRALSYTFTVPDSAALGSATVFVRVGSSLPPHTTYSAGAISLSISGSTGVGDLPARLALSPVFPNPASQAARVAFALSRTGRVRATVHAIDGRRVRTLVDADLPPGPHVREWDGRDQAGRFVGSGAYFVRLEAEGRALVRRMAWLR